MSEQNTFNVTLRSFESQILYFNGMYKLPVAPYPTVHAVIMDEQKKHPTNGDDVAVCRRLHSFKKILSDELNEIDLIVAQVQEALHVNSSGVEAKYKPEDFLTDMADLLGDIMVYCASEMAKYGIPQKETLAIIMSSNFSKLDNNGNPIYDSTGKVMKGPNYWKPEPAIKKMLEEKILQAKG